MTTPPTILRRLLDHIERLAWDAQDARLRADGWEVIRVSRWRRQYRHPRRFTALREHRALPQSRATDHRPADDAGPDPSLLAGSSR